MRMLEKMFALQNGVRCRGIGLSASRAYVKERFGEPGWQELLAALPDERTRAIWDAIIAPDGWYAGALYDRFLDALASCFGETAAVGEELGRRIARAEIHHRIFLHDLADLGRALDESPRLWNAYFSEGAIRVTRRRSDELDLALDNPGVHRMVCGELVVGWGSEILEAAGATIVENTHHRCVARGDGACAYRIRWRLGSGVRD
jgi:hypothetical protein